MAVTSLTGGCACGAIRYEVTEEPIFQLICHCTDCRKASGSAFAEVLLVATDRLSMLGREPKFHSVKADSGRTISRGFCDTCGSPIMAQRQDAPQLAFIQAGSLDDPMVFKPAVEVYTCRAHPAIGVVSGAERFDKGSSNRMGPAIEAHFKKRP